jgi:hypothetical protein
MARSHLAQAGREVACRQRQGAGRALRCHRVSLDPGAPGRGGGSAAALGGGARRGLGAAAAPGLGWSTNGCAGRRGARLLGSLRLRPRSPRRSAHARLIARPSLPLPRGRPCQRLPCPLTFMVRQYAGGRALGRACRDRMLASAPPASSSSSVAVVSSAAAEVAEPGAVLQRPARHGEARAARGTAVCRCGHLCGRKRVCWGH